MIDEYIKTKLYRACTLIKLPSGELIVALVTRPAEQYVTMSFPYLINDEVLTPFLAEACDRKVDISLYQITIAKRANSTVADMLFEQVMTHELTAFNDFVKEFVQTSVDDEVTETESRVLH